MTNHVTEALIPSLHDSSMLNKKELVFVKVQNTLKVANKIRIIYRLFYKVFGCLFEERFNRFFYSGKIGETLNLDRV